MDFLKEFYSGKIRPADANLYYNPEYKKAEREFSDLYSDFINGMPQERIEQLGELLEANNHISSIAEEENFNFGFSLGVQMVYSCFNCTKKHKAMN
ncbi:MAG: hypothetical protein IJA60_03370 [Clostridia bacterium]|nr:hypothetical protein [Clostridia bacterium]